MHIPGIGGHHETVNYTADHNTGGWPDTNPGAQGMPSGSSVDTLPKGADATSTWHVPIVEHDESPAANEMPTTPAVPELAASTPEPITPTHDFGPAIPMPEAAPAAANPPSIEHMATPPAIETPPSSIAPMPEPTAGELHPLPTQPSEETGHATLGLHEIPRVHTASEAPEQAVETPIASAPDHALGNENTDKQEPSVTPDVVESPLETNVEPATNSADETILPPAAAPIVTNESIKNDISQSAEAANSSTPDSFPEAPAVAEPAPATTETSPDHDAMMERHRKAQNLMSEARQNIDKLAAGMNKAFEEMQEMQNEIRDGNARLEEAQQALDAEM